MSTTGVVLSVDVERYGDTLMAATATTDTVLQVSDVVDFADEDDFAAGPQWLVIGDSAPMQYVSVDDDADTVTLAAPVGAVYEAGEPVRMWDASANAEVVGYLCWVELDEADEGDQPIPAEVTHDRMVYFGVDNLAGLIGARVSLVPDEDDPEAWHVDQVIGRAPVVDPGAVATPHARGNLTANKTVGSNALPVEPWAATHTPDFLLQGGSGIRVLKSGTFLISCGIRWSANATGHRTLEAAITLPDGSAGPNLWADRRPAASHQVSNLITTSAYLEAGSLIRFLASQGSGGNLDVLDGEANSQFAITWMGP